MATEIKLPELGENVSSGDLLKVLVKPGDHIAKDQALLEIETDKATVEVPSPIEGVVRNIAVKEGQKLKVGQVVLSVDENGASRGAKQAEPSKQAEAPNQTEASKQAEAPKQETGHGGVAQGAAPPVEQPLPAKGLETKTAEPSKTAAPKAEQPARPAQQEAKPQPKPAVQQAQPQRAGTSGASAGNIVEVKLPELGENVKSGDLLRVLVKVGDKIAKDQSLAEIETDKATVEVPSPVDGLVKALKAKPGDKLRVGQLLMLVATEAGAPAAEEIVHETDEGGIGEGATPPLEQPAGTALETRTAEAASQQEAPHPETTEAPYVPPTTGKSPGDVPASPSVRMLAREIGIDITAVKGSGPNGRITHDDVKAFARSRAQAAQAGGVARPAIHLPDFAKWGSVEKKSMSAVRRKTAEHMEQAWTIPHVTNSDKADITNLEELRKKFGKRVEDAGGKLTMTAIALKVVASALKVFPQFAASIDTAREEIIYKHYAHVGVAVDTERGLLVPVIRDVDKKNIVEISVELQQLAQRARDRKIKAEDLEGSVFTITNLGGIGGTTFTPIINSPEVAILGMMRSAIEPVYIDGKFEPRLMLPLSLSYDHRLIDGADAARFLRWLCDAFEQPFLLSLQG